MCELFPAELSCGDLKRFLHRSGGSQSGGGTSGHKKGFLFPILLVPQEDGRHEADPGFAGPEWPCNQAAVLQADSKAVAAICPTR